MRSWLDRPLSVAGRVMVREKGKVVSRLVNVDRDLLVIPGVAIHMDREVNKGTALKANVDLLPLFACGKEPGAFRRLIAEAAGVEEADLLTTDLFLYPRTRGTLTGVHEEFVASSRLDDLQCVFGCLRGFLAAEDSRSVPVLAVFNNEEVGSETKQGAASNILNTLLRKINRAFMKNDDDFTFATENGVLLSADNAHAVHPSFPEKSDVTEKVYLNKGVVIKHHVNYSTDALSSAVVKTLLKNENIDILKDELKKLAYESVHFFPDDTLTDQPERVIAGEIIREKMLLLLDKEVPHGVAVSIEKMRERPTGGIMDIEAVIYCEKESHKGIIIGKKGEMLKKISSRARVDMESFFQCKINLQCWVKVKEGWRNREGLIHNFGLD